MKNLIFIHVVWDEVVLLWAFQKKKVTVEMWR